jgi:hypothetical protein
MVVQKKEGDAVQRQDGDHDEHDEMHWVHESWCLDAIEWLVDWVEDTDGKGTLGGAVVQWLKATAIMIPVGVLAQWWHLEHIVRFVAGIIYKIGQSIANFFSRLFGDDEEEEPKPKPRKEIEPDIREQPRRPPCFAAGTLVLMADGAQRAIEAVQVGDVVLTYDEGNKRVVEGVVEFHHHTPPKEVVEIEIEGVGKITVTPGHSFFVDGSWRSIRDIPVGTDLFYYDPDLREAMPRRLAARQPAGVLPAHNLAVSTHHCYFVHGILAHNATIRGS